ncbi:MAG TPA: hypothetical protein VFT49_01445 [Candidatus Saccharimonadales bacterium]|nr:hypothetical protein [Candidatus Saccharimonadales bacterium]
MNVRNSPAGVSCLSFFGFRFFATKKWMKNIWFFGKERSFGSRFLDSVLPEQMEQLAVKAF